MVLWIAFIFQYLWDTTQLFPRVQFLNKCCELLSFFSIFGIQHNWNEQRKKRYYVVNCFHFSVSLGYNTTFWSLSIQLISLWIAFIFQYLWDTTQLSRIEGGKMKRCELLSFFSIFGIQHNGMKPNPAPLTVVNCFHFSVSLGYNTTQF